MIKLTELEAKFMNTLPKDNFYEDGFDSSLWVDNLMDTFKKAHGVENNVTRGVLSSLVKKKMVYVGDEYLVIDDNGIEWLKSNSEYDFDEHGYIK